MTISSTERMISGAEEPSAISERLAIVGFQIRTDTIVPYRVRFFLVWLVTLSMA